LDLAAGIEFLTNQASGPWLSANLRDRHDQPIFPGERVINRGGLAIGVIGITGDIETGGGEYRLADWQEVVPNILERLLASCDLLVVLSSLAEADTRELLRRHPEIHVLLSADRQRANVAPMLSNRSLTTQTANQGRYLGILNLSWFPGATPAKSGLPSAAVALGNGTRQIWATFSGESLPLGKNLAEEPVIATKVKEALERIRQSQP